MTTITIAEWGNEEKESEKHKLYKLVLNGSNKS
jgi:hypothetical protein